MSLSVPNNPRCLCFSGVTLFLLTLGTFLPRAAVSETPGEMYLMNGNTVPGWMQRIEGDQVVWKARGGQIGTLPVASIRNIRLQPPPEFRQAVQTLKTRPDSEAFRVLEGFANRDDPATYYPLPGNLASLAIRALYDSCRKWGQVEQAARWAAILDPGLLPQTTSPPMLEIYRALDAVPTERFFESIASEKKTAAGAAVHELHYLEAVAHELRGESQEALGAYARVYSPAGGVLNPHGEFAIQRTIQMLKTLPPGTIPESNSMIKSLEGIKRLLYGADG